MPAATAITVLPASSPLRSTATGTELAIVLLLPNCPLAFSPHAHTLVVRGPAKSKLGTTFCAEALMAQAKVRMKASRRSNLGQAVHLWPADSEEEMCGFIMK